MTGEPLLPGISSQMVESPRLKSHVLTSGPDDGIPVLFVHGNVSASRFWEETMLALPDGYRALAPDLRGYGETEAKAIDATRGLRDWSDDLHALAEALELPAFHLVGWSMGGGVAMQYAIDHPERLRSLLLLNPVSPYGFGGTKDASGTVAFADHAGTGGGTVNPEFVQRLSAGDRSGDSPNSPRNVMNTFYFKPPFQAAPEREEVYVSAMLSTRVGEDFYPGDLTPSENWPTVAPGTRGVLNTMSPGLCDLTAIADLDPAIPVLWVRGAEDQIVSDTSFFDFGFLGQIGAVPGWPGAESFPPQPMVQQTRAILDRRQEKGGAYEEKVIADCGHSPQVEKPEEFQAALRDHLSRVDQP